MIEPFPQDWLRHPARLERLEHQLGPAWRLLAGGGLERAALMAWLKEEIRTEQAAVLCQRESARETNHEQTSHAEASISSLNATEEPEVGAQSNMQAELKAWCHRQWGHQLEQMFLNRKEGLDQISCRLLRVNDSNLALELYYRIKENEATFESASFRYGLGPEAHKGGQLPRARLDKLPYGLGSVVQSMVVGEVGQPCKLGRHYAIIQLEERIPARYDSEICEILLKSQFKAWAESVCQLAEEHLIHHLTPHAMA